MPFLITHCRCGVELQVRHGGVIHCSHCDNPCPGRRECGFCQLLDVTCSTCGTEHPDAVGRRKCEALHS